MKAQMRFLLHCAAVVSVLGLAPVRAATAPAPDHAHPGDQPWGMLQKYCGDCHNAEDWAGGVAFDTLTPGTVPENAKIWESTVRRLRGSLMPPPGSPRPEQRQIDQFVSWMEGTLDTATQTPRSGYVAVQRLNRLEYANAVKSLVGVDIDPRELLPPENEVEGFDNVAAALSVSPAFLDQYISAGRIVANIAVGDRQAKLANTFYAAPGGSQDSYIDGFPLGTRGGMKFRHNFPADGEYRINILDLDVGLYPRAVESRQTLIVLVGGREIFRGDIGGPEDLALVDHKGAAGSKEITGRFQNIPAQVSAGVHDVVVTFVERARAQTDEPVGSGTGNGFGVFGTLRLARLLDGVQVVGPQKITGLSQTLSRQKIFICEPSAVAEEPACARRIAENLARRAFRRPVDATDVDRLLPFYELGYRQGSGGFDSGVRQLVTAVLSSPDFLYRAIAPAATTVGNQVHTLTQLELASRLAFFLWSQGPDEQLIDLAADGRLQDPGVMQAQVRRMLADPRAATLVTSFALKWLNLDELEAVEPDPKLFPRFNAQLRRDFSQEMELFLKSVLLEDRSVVTLLDANYTFANEQLARHYGIAGVAGPQFRRVALTDPARFGLLGKGAVLLRTSYGDRTSPVLRGAWVLDKLVGTPPTPPPPNVASDLSQPPGEAPKTVRARLELHRSSKSCNQCHGVIDPFGLALENFDATGQWRETDKAAQQPIDAHTVLPNGDTIKGPVELRADLMKRPEQFVLALTQRLMMYSLGREVEYSDMPQVRAIVREARSANYTLASLVMGIVGSDAFRLQSPPHDGKAVKPLQASATAAHSGNP